MAKVKQTKEDLMSQLKDQIQLLLNSCELFDKGFKIEAKNIAVRIRVLLYDARWPSLLTQLDKKDILFYDSTHDEGLLTPFMSFIGIRITSKGAEYFPLLDTIPQLCSNKKVNFEEWWNKAILKGPFTRKDLVLAIANTDGGAHVDLELDKKYAGLTRKSSLGWKHFDGKNDQIIMGSELAVLRQIAHEVLKSFEDEFSELFNDNI